jgi:hypothetical protein
MSQLADAGRWDASFHISLNGQRELVDELMANMSREELCDLAETLPFDVSAATVVMPATITTTSRTKFSEYLVGVRNHKIQLPSKHMPVAVYCALVAPNTLAVVLEAMVELAKTKKKLLEGLKAVQALATGKQCDKLLAALRGKLTKETGDG